MGRPAESRKQIELLDEEHAELESAPARRKAGPEDEFAYQCRRYRLPRVVRQFQFAKAEMGRRWAFDFAFPDYLVAVEIEGLIPRVFWEARLDGPEPIIANGRVVNVLTVERQYGTFGRHASIKGMRADMEKYNTAAMLGWTVLRFEQRDVKPGHAIAMTQRVLAARGWRREES